MNFKKLSLLSLLTIGIACLAFYILAPQKMNILIISVCSIRSDRMGMYSGDQNSTPHLNKLASSSFIFENAITNFPWSNISRFFNQLESVNFKERGYQTLGNRVSPLWLEHLQENGIKTKPANYYYRIPFGRHFRETKEIKRRLLESREAPFFLMLHFKLVHVPYHDIRNKSVQQHMSDKLKKRFKLHENAFLNNTTLNPATSIIFRQLSGNNVVQLNSKSKNGYLLYNQDSIQEWKNSDLFKVDLELVNFLYNYSLNIFDESIKELLNLYNDTRLQKNTVVIFTGDHGESIMEHDELVHGSKLYDQTLNFPLFIKFPDSDSSVRITKQFSQKSIFKIVQKITTGELGKDNIESFINNELNDDVLIARNCTKSVRSIRFKNKWKLILNLHNDSRELYDLENDKNETRNLVDKYPNQAAKLEELLLSKNSSEEVKALYCN